MTSYINFYGIDGIILLMILGIIDQVFFHFNKAMESSTGSFNMGLTYSNNIIQKHFDLFKIFDSLFFLLFLLFILFVWYLTNWKYAVITLLNSWAGYLMFELAFFYIKRFFDFYLLYFFWCRGLIIVYLAFKICN